MFVVCTSLTRLCELLVTSYHISYLLFFSLWGLNKLSTISPQYASVRSAASYMTVRLLPPVVPSSHSGSAAHHFGEEMNGDKMVILTFLKIAINPGFLPLTCGPYS